MGSSLKIHKIAKKAQYFTLCISKQRTEKPNNPDNQVHYATNTNAAKLVSLT
jgi:hypothetical protein